MPRFTFRFSTLLKHRRHLEWQCQRDLATRLRTQMILKNQLRTMQETISQSKLDIATSLVGKVDVDAVRRIGSHGAHMQLRGQQVVLRLAHIERDIHQARSALIDATRQRKALELLRKKHFEAWQAEQRRRETNQMDELATGAFVRKMMTGVA